MFLRYLISLATIASAICYPNCAALEQRAVVVAPVSNKNESDRPAEVIVVRGIARPDGGSLLPFYRIPSNDRNLEIAAKPPDSGSHSVVFLDADGRILQRVAWTPDFKSKPLKHPADEDSFTWLLIPQQGVAEVELRVAGLRVSGFQVNSEGPKVSDLKAEITAEPGKGSLQSAQLTWTVFLPARKGSENAPRGLSQVYYSNDDGDNWTLVKSGLIDSAGSIELTSLPGGPRCRFRVSTTDGFNAGHQTSRPFSVADKSPTCTRIAPRTGKTCLEGAGVLLIGRCVDLEDGPLPDDRLQWKSDIQGDVGSGQRLVVRNLSVGTHRITLHCRDRAQNEGVSSPLVLKVVAR